MRKIASTLVLVALLITAAAGALLVGLGKPNPYKWITIRPPAVTAPPTIELLSPQAQQDEKLSSLANRFLGLKPPRFPTVFEARALGL